MNLVTRHTQLLTLAQAAVDESGLTDAGDVEVTGDGRTVQTVQRVEAGVIVIYPLPALEFPNPKITRVTWTYGVASTDLDRVQTLVSLLTGAGLIMWGADRATPTDFEMPDGQDSLPGYSITHTEEHRS